MDQGLTHLIRRVDRLERKHLRLRRIGSAVLVGLVGIMLMGQTAGNRIADVIQTQKVVLRDAAGKVRGEWGLSGDGKAVGLHFWNEDGSRSFSVSGSAQMTLFNLWGPDAGALLSLAPEPFGNRLSFMIDKKLRLSLGGWMGGSFGLKLHDASGRSQVGLLAADAGASGLQFSQSGQTQMELILDHDGPLLRFLDPRGNPRLGLVFHKSDHVALTIRGADGKSRAHLMMLPDGSTDLRLVDSDDRVIWKAP